MMQVEDMETNALKAINPFRALLANQTRVSPATAGKRLRAGMEGGFRCPIFSP